ncbi:unnamed protein product [Cuscuta epithymum]|uniref:Uncharacterized protein n=1 Tax=Cuscuta epithymum TaxID=186058 RepID=A0AAV0G1L2_9ASTE|nr:unnamed protein product [Cuscuta epithymum]
MSGESDLRSDIRSVDDGIPGRVPRKKGIGDIGAGRDNGERVCLGVGEGRLRKKSGESQAALAGRNVGVENIHGSAALFQLVHQIRFLVLRLEPPRSLVPHDLRRSGRSSASTARRSHDCYLRQFIDSSYAALFAKVFSYLFTLIHSMCNGLFRFLQF